jgi:hypothetical protein
MPDGVVSYGDRTRRPCRSRSPANVPHAVSSRERAELLRQQTEQADRNNWLLSTRQRGVLDIPGALGTEQTGATATLWENLLTTAAPKALAGIRSARAIHNKRRVLMGYQ